MYARATNDRRIQQRVKREPSGAVPRAQLPRKEARISPGRSNETGDEEVIAGASCIEGRNSDAQGGSSSNEAKMALTGAQL